MNKTIKKIKKQATIIQNYIWLAYNLPVPVREYKFHPVRKWRIDYCWPDPNFLLAIEIEGGVWQAGRHTRGSGFVNDMEKYNAMAEFGWTLLRYEPKHIDFDQIKRVYLSMIPIKF
jgi:very-short-patch-repair endonuclease